MKPEVGIAQLAHTILGSPEENLDRFRDLMNIGSVSSSNKEEGEVDVRLRTLALLSATAVMIDILPSLIMTAESTEDDNESHKKSSREQHARIKRSQQALTFFDQLLHKMNKIKLVRGTCSLLNSAICSRSIIDSKRLQQLVSSAVSMACISREAITALRQRIRNDLANNVENLEIVRLIVTSITHEKNPQRLNTLIPILEGIRFSSAIAVTDSTFGGAKVDRQLAKDLVTGRGDYMDVKKIKQTEAVILADLMALFVRITRAAQSGQYSFRTVKTCIEGISINTGSVNADLAVELEGELLELARFYLITRRGDNQEDGVLGALALSALLSISKGTQMRNDVLSSSLVSGIEQLVPIALNRLLSSSTEGCDASLTALCKGAIAVAAQFGSDKCLLAVAQALLNSLCMRYDDNSKLVSDLLIHVAARSNLVRSAIDPDGVLVDGADADRPLDRVEVSMYWQLQSLVSNLCVAPELSNSLLGNMSKYCRFFASRERADAVKKDSAIRDERIAEKKKRKMNRH
jgi:hypothetical protein